MRSARIRGLLGATAVFFTIASIPFVALPGLASSTTYYVLCTGNDANNGYHTRYCTVK